MAVTAQYGPYAHGDQIKTSIRGRRTGLDNADYLVGHSGIRDTYEIWTSGSTATSTSSTAQLSPTGISMIQTSTAAGFYMAAPAAAYVGATKTIEWISTGGGANTVTLIDGKFQTSQSSTTTILTFTPASTTGAYAGAVTLRGIQTASTTYLWALSGTTGVTGGGSTHIAFS
jgi:plastocyanin